MWQRSTRAPSLPVEEAAAGDDEVVPDGAGADDECVPPLRCALDGDEVPAAETEPRKEQPATASTRRTAGTARGRGLITLPR